MPRTTILLLCLLPLLAGCSARTAAPARVEPGVEQEAVAATALKSRLRVVFAWAMEDRDARFSGEGATRLEPPYRARLDLFGPRGEPYLAAALVDFELRMPPGMPPNLLPPPPLMWSVIGVVRPPPAAQLVSATRDSAQTRLHYQAGGESWTFTLAGPRLQRAEWQGPQQGRQTVEIKSYHARGIPAAVVFRDWRAFRQLSLELIQVYDAEPFPADTWLPGIR